MGKFWQTVFPSRAVDTSDEAGRSAHLDRNVWQTHRLPEHMPHDVNCFVDPNTGVTWIHSGMGEEVYDAINGYHQADTDHDGHGDTTENLWRGVLPPDTTAAMTSDPAYQHWYADLASSVRADLPEHPPEPGFQATYHPVTGALSDSSSFDAASPMTATADHRLLDVGTHDAFGGDYVHHDMSSGADFSGLTADSDAANSGDCSHGEYDGGDTSTSDHSDDF